MINNNNNSKGNNNFVKAFLVLILYGVLSYQFPYSNKSMVTVLVPPIHLGEGTLYLSGIVSLVFLAWFIKLITSSDRYESKKFLVFIVVLFLFTPVTNVVHDVINFPFYQLQEDVKLIEIKDSYLSFSFMEDDGFAKVRLTLKGHKGYKGPFKVDLELDEATMALIDFKGISNEEYYINRGEDTIEIEVPVKVKPGQVDALFNQGIRKMDYYVVFYNAGNTSRWYRNDEY